MSGRGVSAIVLAGGRSSRFGRDKLAEVVDGRTLVTRAIDAVRPLASEVLLVVAPDGPGGGADADVRVVHDPVAFEGPLAGLGAGLDAARGPVVLVVGGDMPSLQAAVLATMLAALDAAADPDPAIAVDAVVLEHDGRPRPLPMALRLGPAHAATTGLLDGGERRLRALLGAVPSHVIPEAVWRRLDPDGLTVRDIDAEADLG